MTTKVIILIVLSFIFGIGFIAAGIYFLTDKFLKIINNAFRAKGTAYVSLGVGALTLVFAMILKVFPTLVNLVALVYMIFLVLAFVALAIIYK